MSCVEADDIFRLIHGELWADGWRRIGGIVALEQYGVLMNLSGRVRMQDSDIFEKEWEGLSDFLMDAIGVAHQFYDKDGISGQNIEYYDTSIRALFGPRSRRDN